MNTSHDSRLLAALEQLGPHDHLCSIYESPEEHFAVVVPFVRIGLERGEKCIYIADDGSEQVVREALYAGGIDADRAIATGSLVLEGKEAAYLRHGSFDPDGMKTFWADATAEALSQGFSAVRATGETEWLLRGAPGLERWMEYESRLTQTLSEFSCSALCQYNRRLFPPEIILDVIRTHPIVIYRGVVCRNLYHLPPDEFLGNRHAEREVERLLTNIREREEFEYTLRQQGNELRRSEAYLAEGQRISHTGSWAWNASSGELFWSAEHFRILGLDPSRPMASVELFFESVHPEDRPSVRRTFEQAIEGRSELDLDYRIVRPDGTIRYIHALASPVVEDSGELVEFVGTVVDITDQRNAVESLRESEMRLRQIAENIREVFWVWNAADAGLVYVSPMYEEIFGRSSASLYADSRSYLAAIHPDDRARIDAAGLALQAGTPYDERYRIIRPDGEIRWIHGKAFPVPEAAGPIQRLVGVAEDVTDRNRAEEELRRSERLLRLVLDALPVGVLVVDHSGDIVLSNPASRSIWGGAIESGFDRYAESKGWWHGTGKRIAPEEWASKRALMKGETTVDEVVDIEDFQGVRKTIQNSAVPIRDANDRVTGAVIVNEDVSARKTAERELKDSYHQMRTLTGRLMRAQDDERRRIARLLHETTAQDLAALKMLLARLNRTSDRLSDSERSALLESTSLAEQSMSEIRTLSYLLHPPFLDDTGLPSAIRWYAAGFAERSGIKVDLEVPESFERLPLDTETALFRIVQESLINIHRHAGSETARIQLARDGGALTMAIEDRGHGIPAASLKRIKSGGGGVGVGIAGMFERVEQLGGSLEIRSSAHGTTVCTRLPLEQSSH